MVHVYKNSEKEVASQYSEIVLRRVWHGERFSWWMSNMLHNFGDVGSNDVSGSTFSRFMDSELSYYLGSEQGKKVIAEQYVGLPYEDPK